MPANPTTRRQELLDIAAVAFAERGFANVTVDELGAAAGVSGPALYHHFAGKESLLGEMLIGISDHLLSEARQLAVDPGDLLGRLIRFHAEFSVDDAALITVHLRDLIHATPDDQRRIRRTQARYVAIWVDAIVAEHPSTEPARARAATHAVLGLINSTPFSNALPRDQMIDLLADMADAALRSAATTG